MANLNWTATPETDDRDAAWTSQKIDHGLTDEKGRKVGGYARVQQNGFLSTMRRRDDDLGGSPAGTSFACSPDKASDQWWENTGEEYKADSRKFLAQIFATRNGNSFGAYPSSTKHDTLEAAQAHCEKAIAKQAKAYEKKYGKVA